MRSWQVKRFGTTAEWRLYFRHASARVCEIDREIIKMFRATRVTLISVLFGDKRGVVSKQSSSEVGWKRMVYEHAFLVPVCQSNSAATVALCSFVYANFMLMLCHSKDCTGHECVESFHISSYFSGSRVTRSRTPKDVSGLLLNFVLIVQAFNLTQQPSWRS